MAVPIVFISKNGFQLPLDKILLVSGSGSLVIISHIEHAIHEGHHFYMEGFTELDSAATLYVKLVVPNTTLDFHFRWQIESSAALETTFYEGASGGMAGGTPATPLNNNRNSINTSVLKITRGVTVATSKGTVVSTKKIGGAGVGAGGHADRADKLMLKRNTTYFREFISGGANNVIAFRASWIEC